MPSGKTTNISLVYSIFPEDDDETFNFDVDLKQNWDILDSIIGGIDTQISEIAIIENYLSKLEISNDLLHPNTKVNIAIGCCMDSTNTTMINNSSNNIIDLTINGANGLDAGTKSTTATTYHYFIISGSAGVAGIASLSATNPELPSGYTYFRRILSLKHDSSGNIPAFMQIGDKVIYNNQTQECNNSGWSSPTILTLNVPSGVIVYPLLSLFVEALGNSSTQNNIIYGSSVLCPFPRILSNQYMSTSGAAAEGGSLNISSVIPTNNGQMTFNGTSASVKIYNDGYIDMRGK